MGRWRGVNRSGGCKKRSQGREGVSKIYSGEDGWGVHGKEGLRKQKITGIMVRAYGYRRCVKGKVVGERRLEGREGRCHNGGDT